MPRQKQTQRQSVVVHVHTTAKKGGKGRGGRRVGRSAPPAVMVQQVIPPIPLSVQTQSQPNQDFASQFIKALAGMGEGINKRNGLPTPISLNNPNNAREVEAVKQSMGHATVPQQESTSGKSVPWWVEEQELQGPTMGGPEENPPSPSSSEPAKPSASSSYEPAKPATSSKGLDDDELESLIDTMKRMDMGSKKTVMKNMSKGLREGISEAGPGLDLSEADSDIRERLQKLQHRVFRPEPSMSSSEAMTLHGPPVMPLLAPPIQHSVPWTIPYPPSNHTWTPMGNNRIPGKKGLYEDAMAFTPSAVAPPISLPSLKPIIGTPVITTPTPSLSRTSSDSGKAKL